MVEFHFVEDIFLIKKLRLTGGETIEQNEWKSGTRLRGDIFYLMK